MNLRHLGLRSAINLIYSKLIEEKNQLVPSVLKQLIKTEDRSGSGRSKNTCLLLTADCLLVKEGLVAQVVRALH